MPPEMSATNHTLLVQLTDQVSNIGTSLDRFVTAQTAENTRLHGRIDEASARSATSVESIKDSLSNRGRISPGIVIGIITAVLSLGVILGGAVTSYVSVRLEGITPYLSNLQGDTDQQRAEFRDLQDALITLQVEAAANDAASKEERNWIKRELDTIQNTAHKGNLSP